MTELASPPGGAPLVEAAPARPGGAPAGSEPVGIVIGTEDATPLEFWVGIAPDAYLQLDDAVAVETEVPGVGTVRISGIVQDVRARHEGLTFDSDVFLVDRGVLPAQTARAAKVVATRFEPEVFVPPLPGRPVRRARGRDRDEALYFDQMARRLAAGLSRDGEPVYVDLDFLDGTRGGHVNISGISGVATKTSYALFLLYALFHTDVLGPTRPNTKAIVFNVKGEDLLWLDRANARLTAEARADYERLGLPVGPFASVGLWAPPRPDAARTGTPVAQLEARTEGVTAYYWTVREFVRERYLRFLFAEGEDERSQIADLVARVESLLDHWLRDDPTHPACLVAPGGEPVDSFEALCDHIAGRLDDEGSGWRGRIAEGTVAAFLRRLDAARQRVGHLIWGRAAEAPDRHRIDWDAAQVTVVDIHSLHDRAKRFVTGVVIKRLFEHKERMGRREPLAFLVLDELNRYAPREGWSPIKEVLLDVAERGRSLGMILVGAEQTASEVERRIVANSALRVVGRLDAAEAQRSEYGFLPAVVRARAGILKPGSIILQQPTIPTPLQVRFPFPCWATRAEEAVVPSGDPFAPFAGE
ncbi:MAG TPA: ATP-binding protein [Candidatus Limnocylindrales bacterium]|nr:ATP-binding protein [Candidatus Limnocylindrales bacterium]